MDLILPRTDAGVAAQFVVVVAAATFAVVALRRLPAARLLAIGGSVFLLSLMAVRALH